MIKGVDNQVMTQRTIEYSKDVSAMMRRDEVNNEFADRLNKMTAKQETQAVTKPHKTENGKVKGALDKDTDRGGKGGKGGMGRQRERIPLPLYDEDGLPSVGRSSVEKLLDIEV